MKEEAERRMEGHVGMTKHTSHVGGEGRGRVDLSSKSESKRLNVSASIWPWLIADGYDYNAIEPVH